MHKVIYYVNNTGGIDMVKAVVGANWGDEGKGKITDMLAQEADIIVRFQGGILLSKRVCSKSYEAK